MGRIKLETGRKAGMLTVKAIGRKKEKARQAGFEEVFDEFCGFIK